MRILIYCAHPAQYHFFKNIVKRLTANGHQIKLLIKSKDILETLVREEGLEYENILPEPRGDSSFSTILSMFRRDYRMLKVVRKTKPDLLLGSDSSVAHAGFLTGRKALTFGEDDYPVIKNLAWMMIPFSSRFISPLVWNPGPFRYKKTGYDGYMKLAYLHPSVFQPDFQKVADLVKKKPYCIIRLARLTAHHDGQVNGLNEMLVRKIIQHMESKGFSAILDSEYELPEDLSGYQIDMKKNLMHDLMAFATLIVSDSQSMSVEAAIMGVPSVRFNDFSGKISVLEELEHRYGLTFGIRTSQSKLLFSKIDELLSDPVTREEYNKKRDKLLEEKINVLDFMVWYIGNFPSSQQVLKEDNRHTYSFKQKANEF